MDVVTDILFLVSKITADGECSYEVSLLLGRKAMPNLDNVLKSRNITVPKKIHIVKAMVFPVVTYSCDCWTIKKLEHWELMPLNCGAGGLLRVPDSKEINPANLKGSQPWILVGRTDAEAETSWLIGKVPGAGKDKEEKEKRASEDEMAGWHHRLNGHELGQTSGDGKGQRGLAGCSLWGLKELEPTG